MPPFPPLPTLTFADPRWFLALPLCAALLFYARRPWWLAARRVAPADRRRTLRNEGWRLGARLAWVTLLTLALAGAEITRPLSRQTILFVVDTSASVGTVRDEAEAAVRGALVSLRRDDLAGVVAVAGGTQVEELPNARPLFMRLTAALPTGGSDLAGGLRLASALVRPEYTGRVVLVSDGRQTRGDVVAAARELAGHGVSVDVLPIGEPGADVRLEAASLPDLAYRGEEPLLTARITAERATAATLRVFRDDALLLERQVQLQPGRQSVAVPVPAAEAGLHRYRVDVSTSDPAADTTPLNNSLGATQRVLGPPRVLVISPRADAVSLLTGALEAGGADVRVVGPSGVPADLAGWAAYDATVLADVPSDALPGGAMEQLEQYVRDLGRGLVMTGGPDSFGAGGYLGTPVERALPVSMDLRGRGRESRVALGLVIDRSGSMSGAKLDLAKEAAARSVRLLRPGDLAAVLAFDTQPYWAAEPTPADRRDELERAIGAIQLGGGTEIFTALEAGFEGIRAADADVKHLILLTDGVSASGGDYVRLTEELRAARVTLSTVAIGTDSDTRLLEALAFAGRGRYHFASRPQDVPQIFVRETMMATRALMVDARFIPAAASGGPLLRGLSAVPPLDGYVAATPKDRAEVALVSPEGDPVLAAWQYGSGRSIAWTPDAAGRWTGAWAGSAAATTLWGNVLSWLLPPPEAAELAVRVEQEADGTVAVVAENRSAWDETRPTRATVLGPNGVRHDVTLAPAGPGRYRAPLPAPEAGAYVVQAVQGSGGEAEVRAETGWVAPYPAEYRETGPDRTLLTQVAAAGAGRVLTPQTIGQALRPPARPAIARWDLAPLLLILAALFWPLEIALRRVILPLLTPLTMAPLAAAAPMTLPVPLARALAALRRRRQPPTPPGDTPAPSPALTTADRLLQRKRRVRF